MSKATYLEDAVLHMVFGTQVAWNKPAVVYIGLYSTTPNEAGGGIELNETQAAGYQRTPVNNDAANWPNAAGGIKRNGQEIQFPPAEAGSSWPTITGFGIWDALTGGNQLFWGALTAPLSGVGNLGQVTFAAQSITVTED